MPLFVAGCLESIVSDFRHNKHTLVLNKLLHLKSLMYNSTFKDWSTILELHAAVVTEIERGHRNWGDSFLDVEQKIMSVASVKKDTFKSSKHASSKSSSVSNSSTMFCKAFQSDKCNKSSPHMLNIGKKQFSVSHICATCWLVEKEKRDHPECSKECKHYGKTVQEAKEALTSA